MTSEVDSLGVFITADKWIFRAAFYMQPEGESHKRAIQD